MLLIVPNWSAVRPPYDWLMPPKVSLSVKCQSICNVANRFKPERMILQFGRGTVVKSKNGYSLYGKSLLAVLFGQPRVVTSLVYPGHGGQSHTAPLSRVGCHELGRLGGMLHIVKLIGVTLTTIISHME